jgi:hypothetical protein
MHASAIRLGTASEKKPVDEGGLFCGQVFVRQVVPILTLYSELVDVFRPVEHSGTEYAVGNFVEGFCGMVTCGTVEHIGQVHLLWCQRLAAVWSTHTTILSLDGSGSEKNNADSNSPVVLAIERSCTKSKSNGSGSPTGMRPSINPPRNSSRTPPPRRGIIQQPYATSQTSYVLYSLW